MASKRSSNQSAWVTSVFDDDFESSLQMPPPKQIKRGKTSSSARLSKSISNSSTLSNISTSKAESKFSTTKVSSHKLWTDKSITRSSLAVHKKKIQDVENWLLASLSGVQGHRILLLTGPAGCGKTACIHTLASELGFNVREWINPTTSVYEADKWKSDILSADYIPGDQVPELSQVSRFKEFVLRVNKYGTVTAVNGGCRNLLLVEDIPNAFYRDPTQLHEILRRYVLSGNSPLVLIISDAPHMKHSAKHLLPPLTLTALSATTIQFNPVSNSLVSKALTDMCVSQGVPRTPNLIEELVLSASGDLRTAINALQFSVEGNVIDPRNVFDRSVRKKSRGGKSSSSKSKKAIASAEDLAAIGGKDSSLLIFRALGKVLYCKRTESPPHPLPPHLREEERAPCVEEAEMIMEKSCLLPSTFLSFLHQNYHTFMSSVNNCQATLNNLTDADVLSGFYNERDVLSQYCSIGVRGVMHNTGTDCSAKRTWLPLHGPVMKSVTLKASGLMDRLRQSDSVLSSQSLLTTEIPLTAKIKKTELTSSIGLYKEIGLFRGRPMFLGDTLSATDGVGDSGEYTPPLVGGGVTLDSKVVGEDQLAPPEEEFYIEEMD